MKTHHRSIVWFRQDLRIEDNLALVHAVKRGEVLPLFIIEDEGSAQTPRGAASQVWLHYALHDLNQLLGGHLHIQKGRAQGILEDLIQTYKIDAVYWGRCYEPWRVQRDKDIKQTLSQKGVEVKSFNHSLLWEPWEITKKDGTPYKVFTPFYRKGCLTAAAPPHPAAAPTHARYIPPEVPTPVESLNLLPQHLTWHQKMLPHWEISCAGGEKRLFDFLSDGLKIYKQGRDVPSLDAVSRLSPYLHFGQLSPRQTWHAARHYAHTHNISDQNIDHFCSELGWREFSYSLLFHNPHIPDTPLQNKFRAFPWQPDHTLLAAWQKGQTGYPLVDAGMRELWQTGYMHNRVRMVVASFLVKNLLIPWQDGADWFWDCLFDADLANNSASWQWVAGCGADAAPYFRIFNPVSQSEKFDPNGHYIRRYIPELANMPDAYIHHPWKAPNGLAPDYPAPIVALDVTRKRALAAYDEIK